MKKAEKKEKKYLTQEANDDNLIESLKREAAKNIDNRITQSQRNSREKKSVDFKKMQRVNEELIRNYTSKDVRI
jgi:hypothetical protein